MDVSLGSDGGCTGFPDALFGLDWSACCVAHDLGGSDGQLLDCLQGVLPGWAWPIAALGVAVMVAARPIYNWLQRRGWVK